MNLTVLYSAPSSTPNNDVFVLAPLYPQSDVSQLCSSNLLFLEDWHASIARTMVYSTSSLDGLVSFVQH